MLVPCMLINQCLSHQQMHTDYYKINIKIEIAPTCFGVINTVLRWLSICVSYVVGSKSFRPDIQKLRQMENSVRDI